MKPGKVRAIAICVFRRNDLIFVAEGHDPVKGQTFYRPLGGTIEFGEYSDQTVVREMREEIREDITDLRYLGTLENIFTYEGQIGHEIVVIYEGAFVDQLIYEKSWIMGKEDDDSEFKAVWKSIADFRNGELPLYPTGLLELLSSGDTTLHSTIPNSRS